ncbi:MAG TPA: DUF5666 domain-containing protein [Steroidobacteraceae bacterium]|nr:DUF5666 domain-containing protein [Steroidobacteraceae bacterium]
MNLKDFTVLAVVATLVAFTGCGGGRDMRMAGIEGTGFASGTVTGFGSVIVNGITFNTNTATFTIDGQPGTQADLRVGDVVAIVGPINAGNATGTANSVTFDDNVEGPVESIDVAAGMLVVLGQAVRVDGGTTFDDGVASCRLDALPVGQVVEVSGFREAAGVIRATRIECKAAGGELEVTGVVEALDTGQRRFRIAALTVDYSQAQLQDFPAGQPANGQTVEAKGMTVNAGVLAATRVEYQEARIPGNDGERVEIEGLITRFASATDFDVAGVRVTTTGSTRFEGCGTPFNPPLDTKVEVEGSLSGDTVSASEVECRVGTDLRVSATVTSVDVAAGTLSVLGITVSVSGATRLEDQSDADVEPFRLADLRVGDFVEVRGGPGATPNSIAAALLEREDPEARVELRGIAEGVAQPNFTILGVTVETDASTEFEDESDAAISAATFFAQAPGRLVSVSGTALNGAIVAEEAELED